MGRAQILVTNGRRLEPHRQPEGSLRQPRLVFPLVLLRLLPFPPYFTQTSISELLPFPLAIPSPLRLTPHRNARLLGRQPLLDFQDPRVDFHLRSQARSGQEGPRKQGGRFQGQGGWAGGQAEVDEGAPMVHGRV